MIEVEPVKRLTPNGISWTEGAVKRHRWVHKLLLVVKREKNRNRLSQCAEVDVKMFRMWMKESHHQGMEENRIRESDSMRMEEIFAVWIPMTPDELEWIE